MKRVTIAEAGEAVIAETEVKTGATEVIDLTELSVAAVADVSLTVNVNALSDVLELLSTVIAAILAAVVCATVAVMDVALTALS